MTNTSDSSKRHCMIVLAYYPWAETRVQREAEALVARGYEVDVICLKRADDLAEWSYRGVQIYRLPLKLKKSNLIIQLLNYVYFLILTAIKLNKLHKQNPYQSVQIHNLPDFLVFCAWKLKRQGIPIILDLHDLMPEFFAGRMESKKLSWLGWLIRRQEYLSCRFADHVITVSEHWRQTLIKRGVPAHKCSVVMNVADENIFHPPESSNNRAEDDKFHMIYHGTIVYRYGLDLVIQSIDRVKDDIPEIQLTLLGAGNYLSELKEMVHELNLDDRVTFYKSRPAEELPEIILQAKLGVIPYRDDVFTDGLLPTKLMEYAILGLPAIAARTTAIETYFSNAMVEFFEPGNVDDLVRCLLKLHADREYLEQLADNTQRFNQQYNWAKIGAEYVALIGRLQNSRT